ncbi:enoyl-CoA hydratase/carnithine racemase [Mesorhizobium robiniae]|uniref:Enoyl-CoA hydratase/carnithine racemase n=1 Tax=Mesorhizobium robiniae TaxID=559315 RepID=A0ABV2GZR9_9HYPH|nr:enoyl-CoA hydratase-related protein [Mesorhizobium sp. ZC-5]MCV3244040.1 enoyl-CoA hydratase-related protein [Mesorhizobium sp. ZC-5]
MSEDFSQVLTERRGHILIVTINRPQVRNAFDIGTTVAMQAAMDLLDGEEDLFVGVLAGAGGNFSSGMDLKAAERNGPPPALERGDFGIMGRPPSKPLIAAVEGYALAGGFETCLACDMIVAARDAKFGLPEVRHNLLATKADEKQLIQLPIAKKVFNSEDEREGLRAFAEKRKPVWKGR